MVDCMYQLGIHFDLPSTDDLNRSWFANSRFVVTINIRTHGELTLLLDAVKKFFDVVRVLDRCLSPSDRPRDGASLDARSLAPHVHLGRRSHQVLLGAQVDEEGIGRGISLAYPPMQLRRSFRTGLVERLRADNLKQISALELFLCFCHKFRIFSFLVVAIDRWLRPDEIFCSTLTRHSFCAFPPISEVEADLFCRRFIVSHKQQQVRDEKHDVSLAVWSLQSHSTWLELEG
mmetsp:Transcript_6973/g.24397  ORF Transcript_6973/g.24397 Transcript_6973/m.24397 type:complete len:232 (-) Transcript_6973:1638-2333(-)